MMVSWCNDNTHDVFMTMDTFENRLRKSYLTNHYDNTLFKDKPLHSLKHLNDENFMVFYASCDVPNYL